MGLVVKKSFLCRNLKVLFKEGDEYLFDSDIGYLQYVKNEETVKRGAEVYCLTGKTQREFECEADLFDAQICGYTKWFHINNLYFRLYNDIRYKVVQDNNGRIKYLGELNVRELYKRCGDKLVEFAKENNRYLEYQLSEVLNPKEKQWVHVDYIERASKEENENYYIYSKELNTGVIKVLEKSGYDFLHEPYFAMMGKTRNKHTINPYSQKVVDAAPFDAIPISWVEFCKKFGHFLK
mgnify:CR=1 FL=1